MHVFVYVYEHTVESCSPDVFAMEFAAVFPATQFFVVVLGTDDGIAFI